ncbi:class I SAM-dependent methyltransferase [Chitinispirillales bacterium ANBcel5]|uniref:class I SAM-dependent DNA methyltransferase n=1 Tax=Cellulosispirillum alkaliphilum TaxID=3039283 RepID=UPI002A561C2A|nr:class I SAM-dependent methyltransferase [Chitinispirillales bacterium ANBcel5]
MTLESNSSEYSTLASIYDKVMCHVQYDLWVNLINKITRRYCTGTDTSIFEIGGGTGVLGRSLKELGYKYYGSDLSFAMCKIAKERRDLPFFCANGTNLPVNKKFDLVIFLYDGINYLHTTNSFLSLYNEVFRILKPKGLFLFDVTTKFNSTNNFIDFLDYEDFGNFSYIRHSYFDKHTSCQYNEFTIYKQKSKNSPLYYRYKEKHTQKVYPIHFLENTIPKKLFNKIGIWDGYSFNRYSSLSERVHFLLQKSG